MRSLIIRTIHQIINDKRTLALLILAPLLVLTLINFILSDSNYEPKIAVLNIHNIDTSKVEGATIINISEDINIDDYLKNKNADAVVWNENGKLHLKMLESTSKASVITKAMQNLIQNPNSINPEFVYGGNSKNQFDSLGYVFLGILSFFFVFIISGMALVRERSGQTLERMLMTPIKRYEVVGGYTIGFGIFSAIQSTIIFLYSYYVLGLESSGSVLLCILVMVTMAIVAVSVGALISIFANSEFQMVQFIPLVIVTQIFFSGLIPIDTIPYGLENLCYLMPVYYGCTSLKMIMIEGANLITILPYIGSLFAYGILLFIINTVLLKKYRHI